MSNSVAIKEHFGAKLKELRTEKKLTQKQVAEKAGVSAASIISYEKGSLCPPLDVAVRIAEYLGVSVEEMAGQKERKPRSDADIMKLIIDIGNATRIFFGKIEEPQQYPVLPPYSVEVTAIAFSDSRLSNFITGYEKMKALLDNGTIDSAVFDLWAEKEFIAAQKLADAIEASFDGAEDEEV